MSADTPDSVMQTLQAERRPAIWPWLVMPLVAFTLFYCLDRLMETYGQGPVGLVQRAAHAPADAETP